MQRLRARHDGFPLYDAGLPHFPRNFTRDSVVSALLSGEPGMLAEQLAFCAAKQGIRKDPLTGEEPGKIFHEHPGWPIRGLSTAYNACDAAAMFLLGHGAYRGMGGGRDLAEAQSVPIRRAVDYILSHLDEGLFMEDPAACGARRFALKVTYWKDSIILDREDGEPAWPAVFTLAHIQTLCALRAAAGLPGAPDLEASIGRMRAALQGLWDPEAGTFCLAVDRKGTIRGLSSDALHALFYLEPGDLSEKQIGDIARTSAVLETPAGYRTLDPALAPRMKDDYHARTVWPFEQAVIHAGAGRFALKRVCDVAERVLPFLDTDPEILVLKEGKMLKGGCDPQLWTIAAKRYFMTRIKTPRPSRPSGCAPPPRP